MCGESGEREREIKECVKDYRAEITLVMAAVSGFLHDLIGCRGDGQLLCMVVTQTQSKSHILIQNIHIHFEHVQQNK
jgi:hypothetical protein